MEKTFLIIDSHALIHRAYHALPPLVSPDGTMVNGVYGFLLVLFKLLEEIKPDYIAAAFDLPGPTVRHQAFKEYKAKRVKAPENFFDQIKIVKEILSNWPIPILEKEGYEADDVIGTLVEKFKGDKDLKIIILTGDLDTLQLVEENVFVYTLSHGLKEKMIYNVEKVKERYHLSPSQLVDFKALKGDPSDNVLGVEKVGEKTAQKLIQAYGSLDNLYQSIEKGEKIPVSDKILESLKEHKDQAYFSRDLVTIITNLDLDFNLEQAKYQPPSESLILLFKKLGFNSFLKKISSLGEKNISLDKTIIKRKNITSLEEIKNIEKDIQKSSKIGFYLVFEGKYLQRKIEGLFFVIKNKEEVYFLPSQLISDFLELIVKNHHNISQICLLERKVFYEEFPSIKALPFDIFFDLDIAAWLIDSERKNYQLINLVRFFLKKSEVSLEEAVKSIFDLEENLMNKINILELNYVYQEIEKPLVEILAQMEENGVYLNQEKIKEILQIVQNQLLELKDKIYHLTGSEFNLNSTSQLQEILFNQLKISSNGFKKTKTGRISTDFASLKKIEHLHPIIPLIIQYRQLEKIFNSFLIPLPSFISEKTSRIHPIWEQTATATGRLSCRLPNLQNIPYKGELARMIRCAFEAEGDNFLLSLDYSQIELRLAAHLSSDPILIEAFQNSEDIHQSTAAYLYKVDKKEVTESMRNLAKTLNYGIIYGIGDKSLAIEAGITPLEAKKFKEVYFDRFSGLKNYLNYSLDQAKKLSYAETIFGRKRFLPLLGGYDRQSQEQERAAINMPIQGLAADLIKKAMIEIDKFLKELQLEDKVKLILQVHDELIFEGKLEILKEVENKLKEITENVYPLRVPLKTEAKIGKNWAEL